MRQRKVVVALLFIAAGVPLSSPAWSDPANSKNALPVLLACDDGNTYDAVVAGGHNADREIFTPAHDLDSSKSFVPTAFEDFAGTVYDSEGDKLFDFVEEFRVEKGKGGSAKGRTPLECTFSITDTFVAEPGDEAVGLTPGETYTVVGEGGVSGFVTGPRQ